MKKDIKLDCEKQKESDLIALGMQALRRKIHSCNRNLLFVGKGYEVDPRHGYALRYFNMYICRQCGRLFAFENGGEDCKTKDAFLETESRITTYGYKKTSEFEEKAKRVREIIVKKKEFVSDCESDIWEIIRFGFGDD